MDKYAGATFNPAIKVKLKYIRKNINPLKKESVMPVLFLRGLFCQYRKIGLRIFILFNFLEVIVFYFMKILENILLFM